MLAAVGEVGEEVKREVLSVDKGNGVSTWQNHSNIFLSLSVNRGGKRIVLIRNETSGNL